MTRVSGQAGRLRTWALMLSVAALPVLAGSFAVAQAQDTTPPPAAAVSTDAGQPSPDQTQAQPQPQPQSQSQSQSQQATNAQPTPNAPNTPNMPNAPAATEGGMTDPSAPPVQETTREMDSEAVRASIEQSFRSMARVHPPSVDPSTLDSLFFTTWQYELLKEAKRGFLSRPATTTELEADPSEAPERPRGPREIGLGGIVYVNGDNWTIWLNGERITPDAIPPQIIDLEVKREYIQIKWYDSFNNLIYPIRLRPHQRFNIDNRIFLPGTVPRSL